MHHCAGRRADDQPLLAMQLLCDLVGRLVVDLEELGVAAEGVRVEASVPVIVEVLGVGDPTVLWSTLAIPGAEFVSEPDLFSF